VGPGFAFVMCEDLGSLLSYLIYIVTIVMVTVFSYY
jgi:hypothetical protein